MTLQPAARPLVLALADDEHLVGARHTNWIGLGPFLEEDLAFCSIAQDELGHAIALYQLLLDTDDGAAVDGLALRRDDADYRSCWLAEWPADDWATALVRHWLYDLAEDLRWRNLVGSSQPELDALARRVLREEAFHLGHARQLLDRTMGSTAEATDRLTAALAELLPLVPGLWDPPADGDEADAVARGVVARSSAEVGHDHRLAVEAQLSDWGVRLPLSSSGPAQHGRTVRSPGFAVLHAALNEVIDLDPAARW